MYNEEEIKKLLKTYGASEKEIENFMEDLKAGHEEEFDSDNEKEFDSLENDDEED